MQSQIKIILLAVFLNIPNIHSAQITITDIEKSEEKIVLKPAPYDSLKNWERKERVGDYKQYIGLQIFLPPESNPMLNLYRGGYSSIFLSKKPNIIPVNSKIIKYHNSKIYDSIMTYAYKPYHYYSEDDLGISSDYDTISNKYYTIIDVVYGDNLRAIWQNFRSVLSISNNNNEKIFVDRKGFFTTDEPQILFILNDDKSGDTLYCKSLNKFILVPYFVKQKQLFQNKKLIYDDKKTDWGAYKNSNLEEYDTRFIIKYEDDNGKENSTGKKVLIVPGSTWLCTDVTLLKPTYKINYILKNDKEEQVALTNLEGFIEESAYLKRELNKKLKYQQLLAKQKQQKLYKDENERKAAEKLKIECSKLFGQQNGDLIAQGKVKLNMTKEMCKYAWGAPLWSHKTTNVYGTHEDWYYRLGYSLHFENGILKRIEE